MFPASVRPSAAHPTDTACGIPSPHPSVCPPHPLPDPQREPLSPNLSVSPLLYKPQKNGPVKHCSTKQPRGLVRPSVCAFCHQPPHQHGQSGHFVCLLLLCPWHRAGPTSGPPSRQQEHSPGASLGAEQLLCACPGFSRPKNEAQRVDLAPLSTDDSGRVPSRWSREAGSLCCPQGAGSCVGPAPVPGGSCTRGVSKPLRCTSGLPKTQRSAPQTLHPRLCCPPLLCTSARRV